MTLGRSLLALFSFWFFSFSSYTDYSFNPLAFSSSELNFHQLSDNYAFDPSNLVLKKASNQILSRSTVVFDPFSCLLWNSKLNSQFANCAFDPHLLEFWIESQLAAIYAFDPSHLLKFQIEFSAGWVCFWRTVRILVRKLQSWMNTLDQKSRHQ